MTIALDIDGVITDTPKFEKEEGRVFFGKEVVNEDGFDVDSIFDVSKEEKHRFWFEKYKDYITNIEARPFASEVTHKLASQGYRVIIVTARKYDENSQFSSFEELAEATRQNLIKNDIYFDKLYFEPRPKTPSVEKYAIDFFVEDDPMNIEALSAHTKVIIMNTAYNQDLNVPNTYRATSWNDVLKIIEKEK